MTTYGTGLGVNFYPLQSFRSLFLGAELRALFARSEVDDIVVRGSAFGGAGYLGFKAMASFGLTFVGQLGYQFMDLEATGTGPNGETQTVHADFTGLLLRLNLGWSF